MILTQNCYEYFSQWSCCHWRESFIWILLNWDKLTICWYLSFNLLTWVSYLWKCTHVPVHMRTHKKSFSGGSRHNKTSQVKWKTVLKQYNIQYCIFSIGTRDRKDEGSLQEWIIINLVVNGTTLKLSSKNILCASVPLLNEWELSQIKTMQVLYACLYINSAHTSSDPYRHIHLLNIIFGKKCVMLREWRRKPITYWRYLNSAEVPVRSHFFVIFTFHSNFGSLTCQPNNLAWTEATVLFFLNTILW